VLNLIVSTAMLFLTSESKIEVAKCLTCQGYCDESTAILNTVYGKHNTIRDFFLLCNAFQSNDRKAAMKYLRLIDNSFNPLKEDRYFALTEAMRFDLLRWEDEEIDDIARDMRHSADRLQNAKSGKKTQFIQSEIIRKLDKKIKEKEDALAAAIAAAEAAKRNGPAGGGVTPLPDSIPGDDRGPGHVDEKKLKDYQQNWAKMPPADRARAIQELTRDLPPRYRKVIEEYFKSLNKTEPEKP
jgi:hypothetical protein